MKKLFIILLFSSLFIMLPVKATLITNAFDPSTGTWTLVQNGDFENGTANWSNGWGVPWHGVLNTTNALSVSGNSSAQLTPTSTFTGAGYAIEQTVSVIAGETYVLSAFFNTMDLPTGNLRIGLYNASGSNLLLLGWTNLQYGFSAWQFAYEQFIPSSNSVLLRLVHDNDVQLGNSGYIDDVAITRVSNFSAPNSVPEPPTVVLLVLALIGVFKKRQRFSI